MAASKPTTVDSPNAYQPNDVNQLTSACNCDDAAGFYEPRIRIALGVLDSYSIVAFSLLHRASIVRRDVAGETRVTHCSERVATPDTLHLLCIDPVLGTVAIDGHFLVPRVEDGVLPKTLDDDLVDAMVTLTRNGKVHYAQRHRFRWAFGE